jgi:hypothetical protein
MPTCARAHLADDTLPVHAHYPSHCITPVYTTHQGGETGIGGVGNKKVTSKWHAPVLETELRGRYFVRMTTGGSKVCRR